MSRLGCMINKNSKMSLNNKRTLYKACIRPVLTYASPCFAHIPPKKLNKLQIVQNTFLRRATGAPWFMRNYNLHLDLKLQPISFFIQNASRRYFDGCLQHKNPLIKENASYVLKPFSKIRRPLNVLNDPDISITTSSQLRNTVDPARNRVITTRRRRSPTRNHITHLIAPSALFNFDDRLHPPTNQNTRSVTIRSAAGRRSWPVLRPRRSGIG